MFRPVIYLPQFSITGFKTPLTRKVMEFWFGNNFNDNECKLHSSLLNHRNNFQVHFLTEASQ